MTAPREVIPRSAHRRVALLLAAGREAIADALPRLARALADALPTGWSVATAVRDAPWAIGDAIRDLASAGVDELVVPDFTLGPRDQKLATLDRFMREVAAPLR